MLLENLRPGELKAALEAGAPLLLPVGSIECHGNHLPLGADSIYVREVCALAAERCGAVVAPTLFYGPTGYAVSGPELGTVDTDPATLCPYARSLLESLLALGFKRLYVLVHHQGTDGPLGLSFRFAAIQIWNDLAKGPLGRGWWGKGDGPTGGEHPEIHVINLCLPAASSVFRGDHAGLYETALMRALHPELVDMTVLKENDFWYCWREGDRSVDATPEAGREMLEALVAALVAEISAQSQTEEKGRTT